MLADIVVLLNVAEQEEAGLRALTVPAAPLLLHFHIKHLVVGSAPKQPFAFINMSTRGIVSALWHTQIFTPRVHSEHFWDP